MSFRVLNIAVNQSLFSCAFHKQERNNELLAKFFEQTKQRLSFENRKEIMAHLTYRNELGVNFLRAVENVILVIWQNGF